MAVPAQLLHRAGGARGELFLVCAVRAEHAAVLELLSDWLRTGALELDKPHRPAGAESHAALPGGILGGSDGPGVQHGGAAGLLDGQHHRAHVHR